MQKLKSKCKSCHGTGYVMGPCGSHDCDCIRERMQKIPIFKPSKSK